MNNTTLGPRYRGVNLGNWLVLERWMSPGLFEPTDARDEYSLCEALGPVEAEKKLRRHRETFITADDFRWIAEHGLNAVRLPVGYWLMEPDGPYVGGIEMLDQAVDWCDEFGLALNLDLHGLPGNQGPEHHSGRSNHFRWHLEPDCLARSLDLVEALAQRYRGRRCFSAFSLVNEPDMTIPAEFLLAFYRGGYERVRKHMGEEVAVVIAAFTERRLGEFHRKLEGAVNVLTDIHPYACFGDWSADSLPDYLSWGVRDKLPALKKVGPEDLVVGEWSLGVAKNLRPVIEAMPAKQRAAAMRTFAAGQLTAYEETAGWFFWSYKVDCPDPTMRIAWSYRDAVESGWM